MKAYGIYYKNSSTLKFGSKPSSLPLTRCKPNMSSKQTTNNNKVVIILSINKMLSKIWIYLFVNSTKMWNYNFGEPKQKQIRWFQLLLWYLIIYFLLLPRTKLDIFTTKVAVLCEQIDNEVLCISFRFCVQIWHLYFAIKLSFSNFVNSVLNASEVNKFKSEFNNNKKTGGRRIRDNKKHRRLVGI